jgi:predicted RNA polymerase sigma factor
VKIIYKARARKTKTNDLGNTSNFFSVFNNYHPDHFVSIARSCGIEMGCGETSALEILSTMKAQEKAQAMLNETRL